MNHAEQLAPNESPALRVVEPEDAESPSWRLGRPAEDPEKTKRWGFVTAKPSEYLIHMRGGKVRRRTSGQGASCFKWPWDSVAIIPTSINRLQFTADQVTVEKVGMRVTGLAVYRIVEPEIAFRMLNFSYGERASEKLRDILREMFVGATRRQVANLAVEEVMTKRKDAIATVLMEELAPVVEGDGQLEDTTDKGWGVVLDSVEIQDVRVLSERVFADMQSKFRSELAMQAREAELVNAEAIARREAASTREIEQARLASEAATRETRATAETKAVEIEVAEDGKREKLRAERGEQARLAELARAQRIAEAELAAIEARHRSQLREQELEDERSDRANEAAAKVRRGELELERLAGELANALARGKKDIDNTVSADLVQLALVQQGLPAIAEALEQNVGDVHLTQVGTGANGSDATTLLAGGLMQILEVGRALGLDLGPKPKDA